MTIETTTHAMRICGARISARTRSRIVVIVVNSIMSAARISAAGDLVSAPSITTTNHATSTTAVANVFATTSDAVLFTRIAEMFHPQTGEIAIINTVSSTRRNVHVCAAATS